MSLEQNAKDKVPSMRFCLLVQFTIPSKCIGHFLLFKFCYRAPNDDNLNTKSPFIKCWRDDIILKNDCQKWKKCQKVYVKLAVSEPLAI